MKSYGQIAYEAYCASSNNKSLISGADLPTWDQQKPEIQQAWDNAGKAAVVAWSIRDHLNPATQAAQGGKVDA